MRTVRRLHVRGVVGLVGAAACLFPSGSAHADDWISHGADAAHTRFSAERSGAAFAAGSWTFSLPPTAMTVSSPAVADGFVVFGDFNGVVRALRASDGRLVWQRTVGDTIYAAPAVDRGKVFVPSLDRKLYAFRLADGSVAWTKEMGGLEMASPIVTDGALIVSAGFPERKIVKLDAATGETLWVSQSNTLDQFSNTAAAVAADQVIVGANGGHYYSFDLGTGALRWTYETTGIVNLSAPVVVGNAAFMLPGGISHQLHGVDLRTGQALAGWPIDLPVTDPDIAGVSTSRQMAVSSLAAIAGRLIFNIRVDDALDTNKDALADQFLLRESVMAVDIASGNVVWTQANGRSVLDTENAIPKFWLCPTPAVYQSAVGPMAAVASTLGGQTRVLDVTTGADRWKVADATLRGPSQISPALANGRLFVASANTVSGLLSSANQPPSAPVLLGTDGRGINNVKPLLRWSAAVDPEHDPVTYQLRIDHDGEILESWEHQVITAAGQNSARLDFNLQPGTVYTVSVRARDSKGAWSDWSTSQTLAATDTPAVSLDGQSAGDLLGALQAAHAGSVIKLGAGTYRLGETLRVTGGVTLQGEGPGRTVISGQGLGYAVTMEGNVAGQPSQLSHLTVADASVGVLVRDTKDAVIKNVVVRDNSEAGVEISANGSAKLTNGTLLRNGKAVKSFGAVAVKNTILTKNQVGFYAGNSNAISSRFNDLYDNTTNFHATDEGLGDFAAAVTWADMPAGDFHVMPRQPSTDRGDPEDDFSAEPMPNGGRINLGAFGGTAEAELSPVADLPAPASVNPADDGGCSIAAATAASHGAPSRRAGALLLAPLFALALLRRRRR
ncbi:MAG TPA: PQQ-binding-like beta-propeller repeat protein [Polyangia bacterium]|nr:PQQ-binding-like beta-propeller repeat protein [Polyangia bacterium]